MAGTNDFKPFCPTDTGTNLLTNAAYQADPQLAIGNQPGVARAQLANKALRQSNYITSCLAQFIANVTGLNVNDPAGNITAGTINTMVANMQTAFKLPPTVTKLTVGAGVYTVPANVAYLRVRLVGGGAGGGNAGESATSGTSSTFGTGPGFLLFGGFAGGVVPGIGSLGVGPLGFAAFGGYGGPYFQIPGAIACGGNGGASYFGGGGLGGEVFRAGQAGAAPGSGGGGAIAAVGGLSGGGGGSGGYAEAIITPAMAAWAATFNYSVGVGGAAAAGAGAGAAGLILIEEFYQ